MQVHLLRRAETISSIYSIKDASMMLNSENLFSFCWFGFFHDLNSSKGQWIDLASPRYRLQVFSSSSVHLHLFFFVFSASTLSQLRKWEDLFLVSATRVMDVILVFLPRGFCEETSETCGLMGTVSWPCKH